jgi:branched-chain amino acid transport system permease protein
MTDDAAGIEDRNEVYRAFHARMQASYLRTLVSPEVIEEHRAKPLGQHSEPLERLLHYFREQPMAGKYAVLHERESGKFRIVALSGVRGVPPRPVGEERFATAEAAYHGLFLRRVEELMGGGVG